jgi:hypothetical protein
MREMIEDNKECMFISCPRCGELCQIGVQDGISLTLPGSYRFQYIPEFEPHESNYGFVYHYSTYSKTMCVDQIGKLPTKQPWWIRLLRRLMS